MIICSGEVNINTLATSQLYIYKIIYFVYLKGFFSVRKLHTYQSVPGMIALNDLIKQCDETDYCDIVAYTNDVVLTVYGDLDILQKNEELRC